MSAGIEDWLKELGSAEAETEGDRTDEFRPKHYTIARRTARRSTNTRMDTKPGTGSTTWRLGN